MTKLIKFTRGGDAGGTCLQECLDTSYSNLVACFGEPTHPGDGYKVDAEWVLTFPGGIVATIYNYKTGPSYLGADGTPVADITDWHVGGHSRSAYRAVKIALDAHMASHPQTQLTFQ